MGPLTSCQEGPPTLHLLYGNGPLSSHRRWSALQVPMAYLVCTMLWNRVCGPRSNIRRTTFSTAPPRTDTSRNGVGEATEKRRMIETYVKLKDKYIKPVR